MGDHGIDLEGRTPQEVMALDAVAAHRIGEQRHSPGIATLRLPSHFN
jgi:hypothetical protein